jgi:hypothetical protein
MRIFSEFEKKLLKKIISLEQSKERFLKPHSFLQGLLNIESQVTIVGHDYKYQLQDNESYYYKVEILGSPDKELYSDYAEVTEKIYEVNDLLNYLLQEGYLIRHEGGRAIGLLINMNHDLIEGEGGIEKIDIYINQLMQEFLDKCAYYYKPTEALRDLVRHKFKTQAERNTFWTRIISIASIVISIASVGLNFYINSQKSKKVEPQIVKLDTSSIDYYLRNSKTSRNPKQEDTVAREGKKRLRLDSSTIKKKL